MDASGLRALNAITSSSLHLLHFTFRAPPPLRRRTFFSFRSNSRRLSALRFSPLCSFSDRCRAHASPNGLSAAAAAEASSNNEFLQVVLMSPQIPGNTGSIARTCAASAVKLHLIEVVTSDYLSDVYPYFLSLTICFLFLVSLPIHLFRVYFQPLGFQIDDVKLKRAGLDYWPFVVVKVHSSWSEFREYFMKQDGEKRLLAFTKRGTNIHSEFTYRKGDWLVFGSETSGLPPEALVDCQSESLGGGTIRIPMVETYVRCLNLSVSVGVALYEASRQLNYEQFHNPSEPSRSDTLFLTEDMFA